MHGVNYNEIVQEELFQFWYGESDTPVMLDKKELRAGIEKLTGIVIKTLNVESAIGTKRLHASDSAASNSSTDTEYRVRKFVQEHANAFKKVCESGFPFSRCSPSCMETALMHSMHTGSPILFQSMILDNAPNEDELTKRLGAAIDQMGTQEIADTCLKLKNAYLDSDKPNLRAGFLLLWTIKRACGCNFEIPESFDRATVANVLSKFLSGSFVLPNRERFAELLLNKSLYGGFLDATASDIFNKFLIDLVKNTLGVNWTNYTIPIEDLTAGIQAFTTLVAEELSKEPSERESRDSSSSRIKHIIGQYGSYLIEACKDGFPFSRFSPSMIKAALRASPKQIGDFFLEQMMLLDEAQTEDQLNAHFYCALQRMRISSIAGACKDLRLVYNDREEPVAKAGFLLLWMVKEACSCDFQLPDAQLFDATTVRKVLSEFISGSFSLTNKTQFIEILLQRRYRGSKFLYQVFLHDNSLSTFKEFLLAQLVNVPMEEWPAKATIICTILDASIHEERIKLANALATSADTRTAEVGNQFSAALNAKSYNEFINSIKSLIQLLHMDDFDCEIIFGRPFIPFCETDDSDPPFAKRVCFNGMKKVFVHGSLMMGVYKTNTGFSGDQVPPYLLAYDMNTGQIAWGIPLVLHQEEAVGLVPRDIRSISLPDLTSAKYTLWQEGKYIALNFMGENRIRLIDSETGEICVSIDLPKPLTTSYDRVHINLEGSTYYQMLRGKEQRLYVGRMINDTWNLAFECNPPPGACISLSTHCGFYSPKILTIIGPTGDRRAISEVVSAKAFDNKLYTIEQDSNTQIGSLVIRSLKSNQEVISGIESKIALNIKVAFIQELCANKELILFSEGLKTVSILFVNLQTQTVTYSQREFPKDTHVINRATGEVWIWSESKNNVCKVSSKGCTEIGVLKGGPRTTLLHVDDSERLYFCEHPFL